MIPSKVLSAFNISGSGKPLLGGQNTSFIYGDVVIKPVENAEYYESIATIFSQLTPSGYRISKPLKSLDGPFVVSGYAATRFEPGIDADEKVKAKLDVSTLLHEDLKKLNISKLPEADDPWSKANNVLWRHHQLPSLWSINTLTFFESLLGQLDEIDDPHQLIHGDLGGNVLFDEELPPLVIDFSPTMAPKKYADAIIVCDSIAWAGVDIQTLHLLKPLNSYIPYIKYAILFRVLTIAFFTDNYDRLQEEWFAYKKIWSYIDKER